MERSSELSNLECVNAVSLRSGTVVVLRTASPVKSITERRVVLRCDVLNKDTLTSTLELDADLCGVSNGYIEFCFVIGEEPQLVSRT